MASPAPSLLHKFVERVNQFNNWWGQRLSGLLLVMALLTFAIVIFRYVFNMGWVWLQELVVYLHSILFLTTCAVALKEGAHVRVDVFYEKFSERTKNKINLWGSLILVVPTCLMLLYQAWPYVIDSWTVFEASPDANGLPAVFILKSFILIFTLMLLLQGLAVAGQSYLSLKAEVDHG